MNVDSKDLNLFVNLRDDVEWFMVFLFEVFVYMFYIVFVKGVVVSFRGVFFYWFLFDVWFYLNEGWFIIFVCEVEDGFFERVNVMIDVVNDDMVLV